jgi:conjugal transfer mating pair stabilization protein TraN
MRGLWRWKLIAAYAVVASGAMAGDCAKQTTVCVDTTPSKSFSGIVVTLAQAGGCWKFQDTYTCVKEPATDYCQPLIDLSCGVTNSVCNTTDVKNAERCVNFTNDYLCTDKSVAEPLPTNVWLTNTSYRITHEDLDQSACGAMPISPTCTQQGADVCTDATPSKNIKGLDVARSCWSWDRTYQCVDSALTSDCGAFKTNPECTQIGAKCTEMMDSVCQVYEYTYRCTKGGSGSKVTNTCAGQEFCMGAACFNTGYAANTGFGTAVSGMELIRQMGAYLDTDSLTMFNGEKNTCQKKFFGLGNCCTTSGGGGGFSNSNAATMLGAKALQFGGEYVKAVGTPYVYDMLWNSGMPYLAGLAEGAWSANQWTSSGNVSVYGFTWQVTEAGIGFIGFDPYSFAFSVGVQVIMSMMSCTQDEQKLGLKRGQNLCIYAGDECVEKFLGACITRQQSYCCYNSRLAKIVAQGAGAQLGKPPSSGSCGGFTANELQTVNFAAIDFSEFIAEIAPTARSAGPAAARAATKVNSYYAP